MTKDIKDFYERYWTQREVDGRLHILENMWIPQRINIATSFVKYVKNDEVLTCLDVGCGEGTLGKTLKAKFGDKCFLAGIDISEIPLKYAKEYYQEIYQADIESTDLAALLNRRQFDYIICLETLEHLFEPEKILRQFAKLVKKDGYLIISFPNITWWRFRIDILRGNFPKDYTLLHPSEHIQNYTLNSMTALLKENGFKILDIGGQFIPPRFIRPYRLFLPILKRFPNLFGYQLVIKASLVRNESDCS